MKFDPRHFYSILDLILSERMSKLPNVIDTVSVQPHVFEALLNHLPHNWFIFVDSSQIIPLLLNLIPKRLFQCTQNLPTPLIFHHEHAFVFEV